MEERRRVPSVLERAIDQRNPGQNKSLTPPNFMSSNGHMTALHVWKLQSRTSGDELNAILTEWIAVNGMERGKQPRNRRQPRNRNNPHQRKPPSARHRNVVLWSPIGVPKTLADSMENWRGSARKPEEHMVRSITRFVALLRYRM